VQSARRRDVSGYPRPKGASPAAGRFQGREDSRVLAFGAHQTGFVQLDGHRIRERGAPAIFIAAAAPVEAQVPGLRARHDPAHDGKSQRVPRQRD